MAYDKPFEHNPNRGSLIYNKNKKTDSDASWWGSAKLDLSELGIGSGQHDVKLSIWVDQTKAGEKKLNIGFRSSEPKQAQPMSQETDDDIPW